MAPRPRDPKGTKEAKRPVASVWPSRIVAVGGLGWVAVAASGVFGRGGGPTFVVLAAVAVVSTIFGMRRWRPDPVWPWAVVAAALVFWLIGGALRDSYHTLGDLSPQRAVIPDLLSLPGYLLIVVGIVGLGGVRSRRAFDIDGTIDAGISSLAVFLLTWVYVATPILSHHHVPFRVRLIISVYAPCSVFVTAASARLAFKAGRRPSPAAWMTLGALGMLVTGDTLYLLAETGRLAISTSLLNIPFALAFVACSSAVCHPSLPLVAARPETIGGLHGDHLRLPFVIAGLCIPALILVGPRGSFGTSDRVVMSGSALVLSGLAAYRMSRAIRQRLRTQQRLDYEVTHDALTGLPNRLSVQRHLQELIESRTFGWSVALLYIDLDRFKRVNDTLGHSVGDQLLTAVTERLRTNVRAGELVTRMGGDEFGVVLHSPSSGTQVAEAAERIRSLMKRPFRLPGAEVPVSASIGVAIYSASGGGSDSEQMLRDADTAMYRAKASGGDAVSFFDASMRDHLSERLVLERELSHALERGELTVWYQPIVRTATGRATGLEALLRWTHPTLGRVEPAVFIPIAEESGLITEIGAWVLGQGCATAASLRSQLGPDSDVTVAVNVSVRQFRDGELLDHVARALARHDLPASALCLELTESVLIDNLTAVSAQLAPLRARGVRILVDDFGTGYSSLAYLRQLPVNGVKIDRSFIEHIEEGGADASLVAAIVAMAGSMGLTTIAEGVEHVAQADRLLGLGCDEAQGYLFAGPQPVDLVLPALRRLGLNSSRHLHSVSEAD